MMKLFLDWINHWKNEMQIFALKLGDEVSAKNNNDYEADQQLFLLPKFLTKLRYI